MICLRTEFAIYSIVQIYEGDKDFTAQELTELANALEK
jgi:hypothetical protein